jgi:GNAT superfamily N-acetyltransferase
VKRFYLDQTWHGRGIARALMKDCLELAAAGGAEVLWLQVWQEASWAVRFYQRAGFTIVGETPFPWGTRVETDWLMARHAVRKEEE